MKIALYSCEGFSREVLPILKENFNANSQGEEVLDVVFIDDNSQYHGKIINGIKVISFDELCKEKNRDRLISVAIANSKIREKLVIKCKREGFGFTDIVSRNSSIYDDNEFGEGLILCANTMITSNAKIGKHFHCNIYSYVAHDCIIGDYVTFAPNVACNGRVNIGDHAYIGTGVVFKQGGPGQVS